MTEQSDANFAASHSGKTFAQFYGTNYVADYDNDHSARLTCQDESHRTRR